MISKISTLVDDEDTAISPIIKTITNDLNSKVFKDKTAKVYFSSSYEDGNVELKKDVNSNIGDAVIELDFNYKDREQISLRYGVNNPRNKVVIFDQATGVNIRPMFISTDFNFKFSYSNTSKSKVRTVLNKLKIYISQTTNVMRHNILFSIMLPDNIIELMNNIKTLQNNESSFIDYIKDISPEQFDIATNRSKTKEVPLYRFAVVDQLGYFVDNPGDIEINKGSNSDYKIEFNYKLNVQRPLAMMVRYPITVNNKYLDLKWLPNNIVNMIVPTRNEDEHVSDVYNEMNRADRREFLKYPTYDDYVPPLTSTETYLISVMSILFTVDADNLTDVLNLSDLTVTGLPTDIVDYLKMFTDKELFTPGESALYFEIFEGMNVRDLGTYVDVDFNIKTEISMDVSKTYRLIVKLFNEPKRLNIIDLEKREATPNIYEYFGVAYSDSGTEIKTTS